ncbi:hypothetical protein J0895_04435, partial [Phormidium pseudopriestleyi FRX01]
FYLSRLDDEAKALIGEGKEYASAFEHYIEVGQFEGLITVAPDSSLESLPTCGDLDLEIPSLDTINVNGKNVLVADGDGGMSLKAEKRIDVLVGGAGNDSLIGGNRKDMIFGIAGDNFIEGNNQHDTLIGGTGNDSIFGGNGNDLLIADMKVFEALMNGEHIGPIHDEGDNVVEGDNADDLLMGGNNYLEGGNGKDTIIGGRGNDTLMGDNGNDFLCGVAGDNLLMGGNGKDTLIGGSGNDILMGGKGKDLLSGGEGDDTLYGGSGKDTLVGGKGADVFILDADVLLDDIEEGDSDSSKTARKKAKKQDVILDFNAVEGDVLKFAGATFGISNLSDLFSANTTTDDVGISSSTMESGQIVSTITFSAEYSLTVFSQIQITEESLLLM